MPALSEYPRHAAFKCNMNSLLERPIADLAPEPRPLPPDRYSPPSTFRLRYGNEAQPAAYASNDDIAQNPGREERKPDNLHCQREGVVEQPHQRPKNETQDFTDGERDKNERDDDHVVKATAEVAFHGPCWATIIGHGARFRAEKGDRIATTSGQPRRAGAEPMVRLPLYTRGPRCLTWINGLRRGWAEQTHGATVHEKCNCHASSFISRRMPLQTF